MKIRVPAILAGAVINAIICATGHAQISNPLAIPGSVLWLDGDDLNGDGVKDTGVNGTVITSWADKAITDGVQSVTVSAGAPTIDFGTIGTHNAVHFTGSSQDKLDNTSFNVASDYTVFTVVQSDGAAVGTHVLSGINNDGTDTVLYRAGNGSFHFYSGQTTGNVDTSFGVRATPTYKLFGYQVNSTGNETGLLQSLQQPFEAAGGATGSQLNGIRIGNLDRATPSNTTQSEAWNGHIAEVVIYNRTLSPAETTQVSKYLNAKYSLGVHFATGAAPQIETGGVVGGALSGTSAAPASGRVNVGSAVNGGVAFASGSIGASFQPVRANDGAYVGATGETPWIGTTGEHFVGIKLSVATTIDEVGFMNEFANRRNGAFTLQYTTSSFAGVAASGDANTVLDPTAINALGWTDIDTYQIQDTADTRRLFSFAPIAGVTGFRIFAESPVESAISELEVWAVPEPATTGLAVAGGLGLLIRRRRC